MKNCYKKLLFPVHIFQINIRENQIIKDYILQKILEIYQKENNDVPDGWLTTNIFTTFDKKEINSYLFSENSVIIEYYKKYINKFFDKETIFEIDDIWLNVYSNGEYQEEHTHLTPDIFIPRSHFSCIHYLQFDKERHNPVTFIDPIETMRYNTLEMESNYYSSKWSPFVNEGDLLMFPPYLSHFVSPSEPTPDYSRIAIAFNLRIKKYGEMNSNGH